MLDLFPVAFPLFCLSGLTTLSLGRLDGLYTLHRRRFSGKIRTNPTYRWIGALALLVVGVVVVGAVLSLTVFPTLATSFAPLESAMLHFINWLFHLRGRTIIKRRLLPVKPPPTSIPYHYALSPLVMALLLAGLSLLFLVLTSMILLRVRNFLRERRKVKNTDEVREQLPVRSTIQARQTRREGSLLEGLDVASARARYREFLNAMARKGKGQYRRRLDETPAEYQQRLLPPAQPAAPTPSDMPAKEAILETLTRAYTLERYGGQPATESQRAYLRRWLSLLIKGLTRK